MKRLSVFILAVGLLGACEGPQGDPGSNGAPGPPGEPGTPGAPGTANVIYSAWTSATTDSWTRITLSGISKYYFDIQAAPVSQSVIDNGVVLIYARFPGDDNHVRQLPYYQLGSLGQSLTDFTLRPGVVRLWYTTVAPLGQYTPSNCDVRYIVIPGGQAGRLNYEELAYEEATKLFNLAD